MPGAIDTPPTSASVLASQFQSQSSSTISNVSCEEPVIDEESSLDVLTLAQEENKQTATYNRKLQLEDEIAVVLGAKMTVEEEEQLGIDDRNGDTPVSELAQQEAEAIVQDLVDLG